MEARQQEQWLNIADELLTKARRAGLDGAEVFGEWTRTVSLRWRQGRSEWRRSAVTRGIGLRVFANGRMGYAYSSDITPAGCNALLEMATAYCYHASPSPYVGLPEEVPRDLPSIPNLCDPRVASLTMGEREAVLARLHEAVAAAGGDRVAIQRAQYGDVLHWRMIANTLGFRHAYTASMAYCWFDVLATKNDSRSSGSGFLSGRSHLDLPVEESARQSVRQALTMQGAAPGPSTRANLVLSPLASYHLLSRVAPAVTGEAVGKGRSFLARYLGEQVASPHLDLVDDPLRPDGPASRPVDDEGVRSQVTPVIQEGRLVSLLHSSETARRAGTTSTGNARRSSYRSTPEVSPGNLCVRTGPYSEEELLDMMDPCIYVYEFVGQHNVARNAISGRLSLAINGCWVRGGSFAEPVTGMTLAGEVIDLLKRVVAVGNNLTFTVTGSYAMATPSLAVAEVPIGGVE